MAKRHNDYEAAFEDYLRSRRTPYVAVDEQRRALGPEGKLKSVDFIVSLPGETTPDHLQRRWLVDVKGRRFPSGRQYWRNWTTREELDALCRWERSFGEAFRSVLVFAYELVADRSPTPADQVHWFRDRPFAFVAAPADRYASVARTLSPRWGTVSARSIDFRSIARPLADALSEPLDAFAAN